MYLIQVEYHHEGLQHLAMIGVTKHRLVMVMEQFHCRLVAHIRNHLLVAHSRNHHRAAYNHIHRLVEPNQCTHDSDSVHIVQREEGMRNYCHPDHPRRRVCDNNYQDNYVCKCTWGRIYNWDHIFYILQRTLNLHNLSYSIHFCWYYCLFFF